jgi:CubicO group peptidase (beta-lactamase class C family)
MKTNYKLFCLITILLAFFAMGCDDESNEPEPEPREPAPERVVDPETYFPPVGSDDWERTTPEAAGWDTTDLSEAIQFAYEKGSYNLMIIHKGKIVAEEYWRSMTDTSQHALASISKSFMSFVIGVMQENGKLSIDDKVSDYLGEGWSASPDTEADITIRHLLTMSSGLSKDLTYVGRPGETWRYSDAAYKILYGVIEKAAGTDYENVFHDVLFSKIGMKNYTWTGRDLKSSARDLAKFGLMIQNGGFWNGEQLMKDNNYFYDMLHTSQDIQKAYGFLWWLNGTDSWYDDDGKVTVDGSISPAMPSDSRIAKGQFDQRIYIVPSLDLVVIRQGGSTGLPEFGEGSFDVEFWKRLMKAIEGGALGS